MTTATLPDAASYAPHRFLPRGIATNSGSPITFAQREGMTFATGEELARFVGRRRGWGNTAPTSCGTAVDSVAWWLLQDLDALNRNGCKILFQLVPSLTTIGNGERATWTLRAFEAAGLTIGPVGT